MAKKFRVAAIVLLVAGAVIYWQASRRDAPEKPPTSEPETVTSTPPPSTSPSPSAPATTPPTADPSQPAPPSPSGPQPANAKPMTGAPVTTAPGTPAATADGRPATNAPATTAPAPQAPSAEPKPETDPVALTIIEADSIALNLRHFGQRFGGNPTGTNAEIVEAMTGGNEGGATYLPPELQRLNDDGELIDRWGNPYFFHSLSASETEIRSAGPDQILWTPDDVISR